MIILLGRLLIAAIPVSCFLLTYTPWGISFIGTALVIILSRRAWAIHAGWNTAFMARNLYIQGTLAEASEPVIFNSILGFPIIVYARELLMFASFALYKQENKNNNSGLHSR